VEKSVQGKLGQQVTLKAQVTVAEGQTKAGIPVTFFIPGSANGVKAPVTVEAVTNEEGIATYSYTRYAATNDTVTVYASGDRSKFSTGYVFWAVDTTLEITEVTTGDIINNGANKTYKVAYKDPETGKPVSGKVLNVSVKENIDVTVDKLQNVTINGIKVAQTSTSNTTAAQVTTDSKGEATFTITGANAEVTPVVFAGEAVTGQTLPSQKYNADALQTTAKKVKFGALQADYILEVTRDGGETAATGYDNGRKYKLVVKDKNGKLAANETVNVAFNEDIDGVISTTTDAKFVKLDNEDNQVGWDTTVDKDAKKITVKTDSKGEASFIIGNTKENTYATPIAWIDVNYQSGKVGTLDQGEPSATAPISYFQSPIIDGSKLVAETKDGKKPSDFEDKDAIFKVVLVNQSGKEMKNHNYKTEKVSYTVNNTGSNEAVVEYTYNGKVESETLAPNRATSVVADNGTITVKPNGKTTSVKVLATGVAKEDKTNGKEYAFTAKEATAKFTATKEISNPYTGAIKYYDTDKKTITFDGKDAIKYAGESGKKYKYYSGNIEVATEKAFIDLLANASGKVTVTYKVEDDTKSFHIINVGTDAANKPVEKKDDTKPTNNAPVAKQVADQVIASNGSKLTFTANDVASDADKDDTLKIVTAYTTNSTVATATTDANQLGFSVEPKGEGSTTVTVVVTDGKDNINVSFKVNVSTASYTSVVNSGNPVKDFAPAVPTAATAKLPEFTSVAKAGTIKVQGFDIPLTLGSTQAQVLETLNKFINDYKINASAKLVDKAIVISSTETGIAATLTVVGDSTLELVDGAVLGTVSTTAGSDGTATPAKYAVKVLNGVSNGTKVDFKFTIGAKTVTVAVDATAGAKTVADVVDTLALATLDGYTITKNGDVIELTQTTPATTTDKLVVETKKAN
ncbi:hypothetical protein, partial [Lysinibacillus sphaericus]|uniref:hypothetical protein n=1 Tax=Lysinibacillus sphaericus TaxID=1421 RepID=UPI0015E1E008